MIKVTLSLSNCTPEMRVWLDLVEEKLEDIVNQAEMEMLLYGKVDMDKLIKEYLEK